MVELSGTLDGISLPALVRLLGELQKSGVLNLTAPDQTAQLAFDHGHLVAATCGQDHDLDALDACALFLPHAAFSFAEGAPLALSGDVHTEALRQHIQALASTEAPHLPSLAAVPRLAPAAAPGADLVTLDRSAVQVLLLVDGKRSVRDIVADRPVMPALRNLALLGQAGLIDLDVRPAVAAAPISQSKQLSPQPGVAAASAPAPEPRSNGTAPAPTDTIFSVCPKLGFADDQQRHYSRPTALHRCYSTDPAGLVSSQEQRELCLGGRYEACPRFAPPSQALDSVSPAQPVPPGVAARLALANSMMVAATEPDPEPDLDDVPLSWLGADERTRAVTAPAAPGRSEIRPPVLSRVLLLIAGGALVGVLILVAGFMALPMLQPGIQPAPPISGPAFPSVATAVPARATVVLAIATSAAQPTAAPTRPPQRTATPTTPPLAPNVLADTRFASGMPRDWLLSDVFAGWRDGAFRLTARQATRFVAVAAPVAGVPDDVVVSATLRKTGGPPGGGYGVIVRNQSPEALDGTNQDFHAYVAEAGDLGEFGIWRREGDHWVDLVPWTRSQAVRQGGSPNELTVNSAGSQLVLTINGIEVARVDDDVLAHGGVGVFAGGDNNEVALDRFTVQVPVTDAVVLQKKHVAWSSR